MSQIEVTLTHGQADFRVDQPKILDAGQRVQVWCSTCSKSFVWTSVDAGGVPPRFCGKSCRARNRKNWQRGEFYPCPSPSKRRFRSADDAKSFLSQNQREFGYDGQDVYACRCGVYHLGHGNWYTLYNRPEIEVGQPAYLMMESLSHLGADDYGLSTVDKDAVLTTRTTSEVVGIAVSDNEEVAW